MYFTDIFQAISIWEDGKLKTTITPKDPNKKEQQVVREVVAGEIIQVKYTKSMLHIIELEGPQWLSGRVLESA